MGGFGRDARFPGKLPVANCKLVSYIQRIKGTELPGINIRCYPVKSFYMNGFELSSIEGPLFLGDS